MNEVMREFDPARYLDNEEIIAEYLNAALEDENPDSLLVALGDIAKARGMTKIAKDAGLGREYQEVGVARWRWFVCHEESGGGRGLRIGGDIRRHETPRLFCSSSTGPGSGPRSDAI